MFGKKKPKAKAKSGPQKPKRIREASSASTTAAPSIADTKTKEKKDKTNAAVATKRPRRARADAAETTPASPHGEEDATGSVQQDFVSEQVAESVPDEHITQDQLFPQGIPPGLPNIGRSRFKGARRIIKITDDQDGTIRFETADGSIFWKERPTAVLKRRCAHINTSAHEFIGLSQKNILPINEQQERMNNMHE